MSRNTSMQDLALESLFDTGLVGTAWADASQTLRMKRGALAEGLVIGEKLSSSFPVLFGMEGELKALCASRRGEITIPQAALVTGVGEAKKITIRIVWEQALSGYTLLFFPGALPQLENAVIRQLRIRRIAEESFHRVANSFSGPVLSERGAGAQTAASIGGKAADEENPLQRLTPRELDIVKLVISGHSNKVIAHELRISQKTVEAHRARAVRRLGVKTSAELIRLAGEFGF